MKNHIQKDVWPYCMVVAMSSSTGVPRGFGTTALVMAKLSTSKIMVASASAAMIGLAGFFASTYFIR